VFHEITVDGNLTKNDDATYLKASKFNAEIYRYNSDTLIIYFPSGKNASNKVLPEFDKLGIKYTLFGDGTCEQDYMVSESDIDKIHKVLKFQTKGKAISPKSVKTKRVLIKKMKDKEQ
jgi:hypothetical protein